MKRAIVTTGGTGGHIFPALAVARELRDMHPGLEVLFVGGQGVEGDLARAAKLEFVGLPVRGVIGRGLRAASGLAGLVAGLGKSMAVVRRFKPQVVAGFGGYAGFCPVAAAKLCGVPTAVHEQNSVPGVANRMLGRIVDKVLVTYPDQTGAFPAGKVLLTGNPIRREIATLVKTEPLRVVPKRVLVLGGSQGAKAVNRVVAAAWPRLAAGGVLLWHQSGPADFENMAGCYKGAENVRLEPFIADMAAAYDWADLVIARAGASTLAELAAVGLPSVLVPFPFATHDHQSVNASYLASVGAAQVVAEKDLTEQNLASRVLGLLSDTNALGRMGLAAKTQARPNAGADIARILTKLAA